MSYVRYVVISEQGTLYRRDKMPTGKLIEAEVGPEGWADVRLARAQSARAFVNDCGHLLPEKYHRNHVGAVLIMYLGAAPTPYAGPVVITGWDPRPSQSSELRPLDRLQLATIEDLHARITQVLETQGGQQEPTGDISEQEWLASAARAGTFASQVWALGRYVQNAATPKIEILHDWPPS